MIMMNNICLFNYEIFYFSYYGALSSYYYINEHIFIIYN